MPLILPQLATLAHTSIQSKSKISDEPQHGQPNAGTVNVIYGSATGLTSTGRQLWHQKIAGIAGKAEAGDRFGAAVTTGDFNNDGYDHLAIGVPGEAVGNLNNAGAANVIYGSPSGLSAAGNQIWHQDSPDIKGVSETGDQFGAAVAAGDFNNDGRDDLAIGVPGEETGSLNNAGAANVIYGAVGGLSNVGDQFWQ